MGTKPSATVRMEIDSVEPIGGWIGESEPHRTRFDGWLQLISLLERAAADVEPAPAPQVRPPGGGSLPDPP